ncbi:MAG TPA: hypothetical protein VH877_22980 [Polyangia bacterium]|jgi:hypothetical protein|nr:hypothetical protein [Polyangia bacterium]
MKTMRYVVMGACLAMMAGCGAIDQQDDVTDVGEVQSASTVSTTLYYEGSCAFLRQCANGNPYCNGTRTCSDTTKWVARPSTGYAICGGTVTICLASNLSKCTTAAVWDTSCCGHWEGNVAVFNALGLGHGDGTNCVGGYGQASVRITY